MASKYDLALGENLIYKDQMTARMDGDFVAFLIGRYLVHLPITPYLKFMNVCVGYFFQPFILKVR